MLAPTIPDVGTVQDILLNICSMHQKPYHVILHFRYLKERTIVLHLLAFRHLIFSLVKTAYLILMKQKQWHFS